MWSAHKHSRFGVGTLIALGALLVACNEVIGIEEPSEIPLPDGSAFVDVGQGGGPGAESSVADAAGNAAGNDEGNTGGQQPTGDAAPSDAPRASDTVTYDAGEGGTTGDFLRAALGAKSPSCLACAEASCPNEFMGCATISGTPDAGRDAAVTTRAQLCTDALMCVLASDCDDVEASYCYCGDGGRGICWVPDVARGVCKETIERAFETTDPKRILDGIASNNRDTGGGWAFLLAGCLRSSACGGCFARPDAGSDVNADSTSFDADASKGAADSRATDADSDI